MSHYQQQYYPSTAPSALGGTPVSSFYARQGFEQTSQPTISVPLHLRSNAYDYRQHVAPPKHPAQQARSSGGQNQREQQHQQHFGHPGPSQPQIQPQNHQQYDRPQSQYGQVQHPYQPPYTHAQQPTQGQTQPQPHVQSTYAHSSQYAVRSRSEFNPSTYSQSMYGYSPFPMLPGPQPTPARAFALYEAYNARQQQREAVAAATTLQTQPQNHVQVQQQTQHQAQVTYRSPPQSQPLRQSQQYPVQQYQDSHVPTYAPSFPQSQAGHPISPQKAAPLQAASSFSEVPAFASAHAPSSVSAPMAPIPQPQPQPQSQPQPHSQPQPQAPQRTPTIGFRRPLPQPCQPRPRPMSMPPQAQAPGFAFQVNGPGRSSPSSVSNMLPQSLPRPVTIIQYPSASSKTTATPYSPSVDPSAAPTSSNIPTPAKALSERTQTPEQVPPYSNITKDITPTQRRALPQSSTAPPDLSHLEKRGSVLNSVSTPFQACKSTATVSSPPHVVSKTPLPEVSSNSETEDDDRLSVQSRESKQSHHRTPSPQHSPQYGILDLPKRNSSVFGVGAKAEAASPKYGIKDLPMRTKSIVDRRKAWERAEQGMNEAVARTQTSSKSVSPAKSAAPKLSISAPPSTAPVSPRSPQPQVPKQQQKLPMPVVRQPQPSRTERTPSWTLATADLEKIAAASEPKTSMALRFAKMSLEEEKASSKQSKPQPAVASPTQTQRSAMQTSSNKSRSTSPTKSYPFSTRTPRRSSTIDLNLDDAPPPSLRRTPSPSASTSSSSVPSIPSIKTPDDVPQISLPPIPQINLPGSFDFDDALAKPSSPQKSNVPVINLPGDDEGDSSGPMISVSAPSNARPDAVAMPVILDDLASSVSSPRSRGLPRLPSSSASSVTAVSNSGSNQRSRGGGLVCGGCGRGIFGRIVSAMGLRWHPQCFKCCQCGEQLEHVSSYEHDGKPYCHLDYHELFAPQCYSCKTPIIDERFITLDDPALGKRTYHEQHFFCAECGDPFLAPPTTSSKRSGPNEINIKGDGAFDVAVDEDGLEVGFTVFRGHPYCEACHVRLRAPKCKACKRSIRDGMRAVEALGGKWCYECFVCTGCQKPFEEPSFFQRDKKPFCEHCFSIILRNEI
ncbi:hypothetical protein ACEPAH_1521 [Sanghuangporus vaninii]